MLVKDCMTRNPIILSPSDSLRTARELMAQKHIRHLPVVDAKDALVGLLTDRDLRRLELSPLVPGANDANHTLMAETLVERAMLKSPITVTSSMPLLDAVSIMLQKKYGALPVVDDGHLVGVLSQIDCLRVLHEALSRVAPHK